MHNLELCIEGVLWEGVLSKGILSGGFFVLDSGKYLCVSVCPMSSYIS